MQHGQHVLLVFLAFVLSSTGSLLPARTGTMHSTQVVAAKSQSDTLSINEFAADNDLLLCDPDDPDPTGCWEDWFEIYNPSDHSVDLQGMYLSDNLNNLTKFRIAATLSVPAGGFLLFWADDETAQGPNHTSFKLSASGESLALVATDGVTVINQYSFGPQLTDISEGRCPDGME